MRTLLGVATLIAVALGVRVERGPVPEGAVSAGIVRAAGMLQNVLGNGLDRDMAEAFLDAVTGANGVVCSATVRGVANGWGGYGSMTTIVGFGNPGLTEKSLLDWAMERRLDPDAMGPLTEGLAHADECRRRMAAALFGRMDEAVALPALRSRIDSPDRSTRIAAIRAQSHLDARGATAALTEALGDEDVEIRQVAAWAMGRVEDPAGLSALSTALRDSDPGVRGNAAWALGRLEHRDAIPALAGVLSRDAAVEVRINAAWALGNIEDGDAVPALTDALSSDADPLVRKAAAWALGQMS